MKLKKNSILFAYHMYRLKKVTAGDHGVLFKKWVGTAWQETARRLKGTVVR